MSLLGQAVVAIWNDIAPEGRTTFIEWHNREHIPERVSIPGFHRGRRYVAENAAPEYFTLYEARDPDVLVGADYLARLNNPTVWTREATKHFLNTTRGVCRTVSSQTVGDGAFIMTLRFDAVPSRAIGLRLAIIGGILPPVLKLEGVTGAHLCIADVSASGILTAEKTGRAVGVPNWIVMVEGSSRRAIDSATAAISAANLLQLGSVEDPIVGIYRLEFSLVDPAPFA